MHAVIGNEFPLGQRHVEYRVTSGFDAEHRIIGHLGTHPLTLRGNLRQGSKHVQFGHRDGDWPEYCRGCDFLTDDRGALVWTNYGRALNQMHLASFSLEDYQCR